MKILAALLSFLIIGSETAEIDSNTESSVSSTKEVAKIPLGNLPAGIFVSIGSFLSFPNGRLAFANKKMKKTFTESFPFERFLTERFNLINLRGISLQDSEIIQLKPWLGGHSNWEIEFPRLIQFCLDRRLTDVCVGDFVLFAFNKLIDQLGNSEKLINFNMWRSLNIRTSMHLIQDFCILATRIRHGELTAKIIDTFFRISDDTGVLTEKQKFTRRILDKTPMLGSLDFMLMDCNQPLVSDSFHWIHGLLFLFSAQVHPDKVANSFISIPMVRLSSILDIEDVSNLTPTEKVKLEAIYRAAIAPKSKTIGKLISDLILYPERINERKLITELTPWNAEFIEFESFEFLVKVLLKRGSPQWVLLLIEWKTFDETFTDLELIEMITSSLSLFDLLNKYITVCRNSLTVQFESMSSLEVILEHYGFESLSEVLQNFDIPIALRLKYAIKFGDGPEVLEFTDVKLNLSPGDCFEIVKFIFQQHASSKSLRNWLRTLLLNRGCKLDFSDRMIQVVEYSAEAIFEVLQDLDLIEANLPNKLFFPLKTSPKLFLASIRNESLYQVIIGFPFIVDMLPFHSDCFDLLILACKSKMELERLFALKEAEKESILTAIEAIVNHSKPERFESFTVLFYYYQDILRSMSAYNPNLIEEEISGHGSK